MRVGSVVGWLGVLGGCTGGAGAGALADAGDASGADATEDGANGDGGGDGGSGACPSAVPVAGAGCDAPGLWCEYGGGAHGRCSTRAACAKKSGNGGGGAVEWSVFGPDLPCANIAACPGDFAGSGAGCPVLYGVCDYDAGRCACAECADGDGGRPWQWQCRAWGDVTALLVDAGLASTPGACPPDRPRLGTDCVDEGVVCGYDACYGVSLGPYQACVNGRWAAGPQTDLCNPPSCR